MLPFSIENVVFKKQWPFFNMRVVSGFSVPWVILPRGPAILVPWHIVSIEYVHRAKFLVDLETKELIIFILVRLDFGLGMIWLGQYINGFSPN